MHLAARAAWFAKEILSDGCSEEALVPATAGVTPEIATIAAGPGNRGLGDLG